MGSESVLFKFYKYLTSWYKGNFKQMPFGASMQWREPKSNDGMGQASDCKRKANCSKNVFVM